MIRPFQIIKPVRVIDPARDPSIHTLDWIVSKRENLFFVSVDLIYDEITHSFLY